MPDDWQLWVYPYPIVTDRKRKRRKMTKLESLLDELGSVSSFANEDTDKIDLEEMKSIHADVEKTLKNTVANLNEVASKYENASKVCMSLLGNFQKDESVKDKVFKQIGAIRYFNSPLRKPLSDVSMFVSLLKKLGA